MNRALFEKNLNEVLFNEYLNCYLALPIFPRTIQYFLDTKQFEEVRIERDEQTAEPQEALQVDSLIPPSVTHSHAPSIREDNYVATLERERALEWIREERLPAFLNSDLYCEYKLASLLAHVEESRDKQPNVPLSKSISNIAISSELDRGISYASLGSKKTMSALKKFLAGTSGENDYLFWIECERLACDSGDTAALKEIKEKYMRPGAKCELAKGRWVQRSQPVTREDIFELQTSVLHSLVGYWCPRYLMNANRNREIKFHSEDTKRSRPGTHQGRGSVLNDSQMNALKCNPESVRDLASPLIFPQLSPTHFPYSSTPNPACHMSTARSLSVLAAVNKLPDINEYSLSESVAMPRSHTVMFHAEAQKRRRSKSVPLPKIIPPVKERKQNQQLTRCLSIEHRKAGGIFQQYIEKLGNNNWKNCLFCWREIQNFKAGFQTEDFNPFQVEVRAKTVFSRYVLTSGDLCVHCPHEIAEKISRSIYPAFEDLFDSLEELMLDVLAEPWMGCLSEEHAFLEQAKSDEVPFSHWEIDDEEFLEELGADVEEIEIEHEETVPVPDNGEEIEDDEELDTIKAPGSSVQLNTPISYTIQQVIQENSLLNLFKNFLDSRHASVDIMFWMEVESFRRIPSTETKLRNAKAKLIRSQYLTKNYYFGINSPASKEGQNRLLMLGGHKIPQRPPTPVLIEGQKQVQARLEHRWLPVFIKTREFLQYINPGAVQTRPSVQGQSSGSQEEWKSKLFESRWMTNSRDIINCRKAILNPVTCKSFETFVELKSSRDEHLKNDLNFWLEIQRFKELCHVHTPDAVLQLKVDVINSCFLQSKLPPKIQVDLSHEMVEKLQKKQVGPYMFREPQAEMFRVIFSYWMEYQAFKDQHKGEEIEIAFMELRQQIHEREMVKIKKQREFERTRIRQQLQPFGMGHSLLHGEEDPPADLMFRLSEMEGDSDGIINKKRANRTLSVQ